MATQRGSAAYNRYVAELRPTKKEAFDRTEACSWPQVCKALCPPSGTSKKGRGSGAGSTQRAEIPIVDSILVSSDGLTRQWLFTSRSGRISRKSKKNSGFADIYATFQDIAKSYGSSNIAVIHRGQAANVIGDEGLDSFKSACEGADSIAAYIPPKGSQGGQEIANFRDVYTRTWNGSNTLKTFKIGAPLGVLAKAQRATSARSPKAGASASLVGRGETISVAAQTNRVLNGYTSKVVKGIENFYNARVLSLSASYVVDVDDTAWLVYVQDVVLGRKPPSTAAPNPGRKNGQRYAEQTSPATAGSPRDKTDERLNDESNTRAMKLTASQQIRVKHDRARAESMRGANRRATASRGKKSSLASHELPELPKLAPTGYRGATGGPSRRRTGRTSRAGARAAQSVSSDRSFGDGDVPEDFDESTLALEEAHHALDQLTRNDLTELRSYKKPPASVMLVTRAVMLLLTGHALDWAAAKRIMANSERFLLMLVSLDKDNVPIARLRALRPFVANPTFHPKFLEPTSMVAARFCSWVRGMYQYAESTGAFDDIDSDSDDETLTNQSSPSGTKSSRSATRSSGYGKRSAQSTTRGATTSRPTQQERLGYRNSTVDSRGLRSVGQEPDVGVFMNEPGAAGPSSASARSKREKNAKRQMRKQQLARLAKSDDGLGETEGGNQFLASDGAILPYAVTGRPDTDFQKPSIVVLQDMFETFDKPRIFLHKLLRKHAGTQALFLNFPGQAYAEMGKAAESGGEGSSAGENPTLNNEYLAKLLHELLQKVENDGDFVTSCRPFYLVGFGNGGNVATYFASTYGKKPEYAFTFKGLVLTNSHAYLDSQLSAIYHSSLNVFACFPRDRPDLPVSYFSRFLFSEKYLSHVDKNLVLNIYTAISNPITNDGRVELCRGALAHKDLRQALQEDVSVPIVLIQSTENSLVNAKHVDAFLEGRKTAHVWSHQQKTSNGKLQKSVERQVAALLGRSVQEQQDMWQKRRTAQRNAQAGEDIDGNTDGSSPSKKNEAGEALVFWLPGGHEVCQESRDRMQNIFDVILGADASYSKQRAKSKGKGKGKAVQKNQKSGRSQQSAVQPKVDDKSKSATTTDPHEAQAIAAARAALANAGNKTTTDPKTEEADKVLDTLQAKIADRLDAFDTMKSIEAEKRKSAMELELEKIRQEQDARRSKWLAEDDRVVEGVESEQAYSRQLLEKEARLKEAKIAAAEEKMLHSSENRRVELHDQVADATLPAAGHSLQAGDMLEIGFVFAPASEDAKSGPSFAPFDEDQLLSALRRELRMSANHVASVTALDKTRRKVNVRLSKEAAKVLWRKCREQTLSSSAPDFVCLIAGNGDVLHRDGTLVPAKAAVEQSEDQNESVDSMFEKMAEEERRRDAALAERRRLEKEEEARMQEVQEQLKAQHAEHQAIKQAKKDALRRQQEDNSATMIQALVRGKLAKMHKERKAELADMDGVYELATSKAQALVRRFLTRCWYLRTKEEMEEARLKRRLAEEAQRIVRGGIGRRRARAAREDRAARVAQRLVRGRLGRVKWSNAKQQQLREREEAFRAAKIQSVWRMYKGQTVYQQLFMEDLAATTVQRVYRGLLARRRVAKQRKWDNTSPGAERLELGLKLIANSKESFERQRQEIEALHRDQETAESKVSLIHAGLRESERELEALEAELQGIDQLDQDLRELTHEKQLYDARIEKSGILQGGGASGRKADGTAILSGETALEVRKMQADAYALEMAIHMKRAEREKKKKVLESEFSSVMEEISAKRGQLAKLESSIQDMELTRQRKDREFARLQRDLMELLEEQKKELDHLREKGVELEVATATSAAAAQNTALTAKKHEQKTQAIFQGTEELLKFQFMSMSLGYFNSLNMLKSLRDMNSDTTSSAITTSAQTALAAATAASAAKIPTLKHLNLGANDVIDAISKEREQEARQREQRIREVEEAMKADFPADVKEWNIQHIVQWLDTLMLGQYRKAFEEAAIDGMFLLELTDEDLRDVLGITHQLHRKKLLFSRDKLMPLSAAEIRARKDVHHERMAGAIRDSDTTPNDLDTVFSLARNGRRRQVEDVLDKGFAIDTEDEFGNTLLIVGAQQVNIGLCEMLIKRQANVNRQNHQGNSALHYAMAYDPSGDLGEYLIAQGADDTLENKWGLSPYDGISEEDA